MAEVYREEHKSAKTSIILALIAVVAVAIIIALARG